MLAALICVSVRHLMVWAAGCRRAWAAGAVAHQASCCPRHGRRYGRGAGGVRFPLAFPSCMFAVDVRAPGHWQVSELSAVSEE